MKWLLSVRRVLDIAVMPLRRAGRPVFREQAAFKLACSLRLIVCKRRCRDGGGVSGILTPSVVHECKIS